MIDFDTSSRTGVRFPLDFSPMAVMVLLGPTHGKRPRPSKRKKPFLDYLCCNGSVAFVLRRNGITCRGPALRAKVPPSTGGVRVVGRGAGPAGGGPSRRTFLKAGGVAAFGVGSLAVLPLFNSPSQVQDPAKCFAKDVSASAKRLVVSNWPAYIDTPTKKSKNTLE